MTPIHAEQSAIFGKTLIEVNILVELRGKLLEAGHVTQSIGVAIIQKLDLLTRSNVNVSGTRSTEDLERLAEMKTKIAEQTEMYINSPLDSKDEKISLADGKILDKIINSKIDFLESLVSTKDELELFVVVERLAEVQMKLRSTRMHGLLELKLGHLIESSNSKPIVSAGCDPVVK